MCTSGNKDSQLAPRSPRIRRLVKGNSRSYRRAAACGTCRSNFTSLTSSFCTFFNAPASLVRMGCLNSIFKMRPEQKREKSAGCKEREGLFQIKQYLKSFTGSADDIIFSTASGV